MLTASFKKIVNGAPTMIWSSDTCGKPLFYNTNWLVFRGTEIAEELGTDWKDIIFPADFDNRNDKMKSSFDQLMPYKTEYRLKTRCGDYRWVVESGTPFFDEKNRLEGFIGSCIDIHKLKEVEHQKDDFIVAASHELKTPLTSLNVYLHLLDGYFCKNNIGAYNSYTKGAILQLEKLDSLINNLLDIGKISDGCLAYVWRDFHFRGLLEEIVEKNRRLYPARDFQFSGFSDGYIRGDRRRLSDAIENLLNNAVKYSECNTKIVVEISDDDTHIQFKITDFGIGIDKAYHPLVFNRFYRIPEQIEQTYPGMGIGLYVTKQIIEKHGGVISVDSEKNKYTRFTVRIPLLKSSEEEDVQNINS